MSDSPITVKRSRTLDLSGRLTPGMFHMTSPPSQYLEIGTVFLASKEYFSLKGFGANKGPSIFWFDFNDNK